MGSIKPSPANTSFSKTLKLPPSNVSELVFLSQSPRSGRPDPLVPLHSETFSASISVCAIGTRADWFFFRVTRSLSLYSNRSPSSCPLAAASAIARASSRLAVDGPAGPSAAERSEEHTSELQSRTVISYAVFCLKKKKKKKKKQKYQSNKKKKKEINK